MRRHERPEQERRGIVEAFGSSNQTLLEYCHSTGISIHQYYKWRREIYGTSRKMYSSRKSSFVELTSSAAEVSEDKWVLEIEVSGVSIRVRR